jgi:DNA repair protein RecO (recombination protein O)
MAALYKTKGIVLNYLKYGETSIITKILTEDFGVQSYIVNGARSKKPRFSISYFQPLTLLNMVVYKKKNANLNRISEIDCASAASSIPLNIHKTGIALFISEILNRVLKEEMEDRQLFDFVYHAIQILDHQKQDFENFHLLFLIKLSGNLGFSPVTGKELITQLYQHPDEDMWEINCFDQLIQSDFTSKIKLNVRLRRKLLDDLIMYYHLHLDNLGPIRSMEVLREVMG